MTRQDRSFAIDTLLLRAPLTNIARMPARAPVALRRRVPTALLLATAGTMCLTPATDLHAQAPTEPAAGTKTGAGTPGAAASTPAPAPPAHAPSLAKVRVLGVARLGYGLLPDAGHLDSAGLGDIIVVRVDFSSGTYLGFKIPESGT